MGVVAARKLRPAAAAALAVLAVAAPGASAAPTASPTASQASARLLGITPSSRLSYLEYARIGEGGVRNLRMPFFWEDLQPVAGGGYSFGRTDEAVVFAAANRVRLRPFVMGVPHWLGQREDRFYPPVISREFRSRWKRLMRELVDRYGPGGEIWKWVRSNAPQIKPRPIRSWQIWNEPNAWTYWHPRPRAAKDYADLLRLSARAIRSRDDRAEIVGAGLFEHPSDGSPMKRFLTKLYAEPGVKGSLDALALHPYSVNVRGISRQIRTARSVMRRNGDAQTPLWITELGWPTQTVYGNGVFYKSEPEQARILRRAFGMILSNRRQWRIGGLFWYSWRDNPVYTTCDHCSFSGLFREDLTAKPAWTAFARLAGGTP